jgi:two-component system, OmpR family, sensor histidine kinase SenX3
MRITSRRKATITFLVLGVGLAGVAVAVGFGWIILNWREGIKVFLGVIFFSAITTGLVLNTIFLLREIRRNEQHDSFINAVTHELKTPIASIRLYLQTLQHRDVDESQRREFYRRMLDDTDRLLGTVEQVLKAGVAGHRKSSRERIPIDFESLVRECVEVARTGHHLQPQALRFEPASNNGTIVTGDPEELRTAVTNVLDNAIKYSGDLVDVSIRVEAPDEKHVRLSIRDHGVGIPPAELKSVFKRFYRVSNRSLAHIKGTGLGLFIVRAIAKKHGGRAFAESLGEGHGTTVVVELPRNTSRENGAVENRAPEAVRENRA